MSVLIFLVLWDRVLKNLSTSWKWIRKGRDHVRICRIYIHTPRLFTTADHSCLNGCYLAQTEMLILKKVMLFEKFYALHHKVKWHSLNVFSLVNIVLIPTISFSLKMTQWISRDFSVLNSFEASFAVLHYPLFVLIVISSRHRKKDEL